MSVNLDLLGPRKTGRTAVVTEFPEPGNPESHTGPEAQPACFAEYLPNAARGPVRGREEGERAW